METQTMQVYKFGGTSLADADRFRRVASIVRAQNALGNRTALVLSAPAGITNRLLEMVDLAEQGNNYQQALTDFENRFRTLATACLERYANSSDHPINQTIKRQATSLSARLRGVELIRKCPDNVRAEIICIGEQLAVACMSALLGGQLPDVQTVDPRQFLIASGSYLDAQIDLTLLKSRFDHRKYSHADVLLMPGFMAANNNGETVTLGRNGSDYSAALLAVCVNARTCDIWTDVDGVYNCDPRLVPDARLLEYVSYDEAMELSYFGAKVLHPKTIAPLAQAGIPCRIRNTCKPDAAGTLIGPDSSIPEQTTPHRGMPRALSHVDHVATINVSGAGMRLRGGWTGRIFDVLTRLQIPIFMATQSSSQYNICFCIPQDSAAPAKQALQQEFDLEITGEQMNAIEVIESLAVVSVVGDGMRTSIGIAARLFTALAESGINIVAIAQGASERSISVVVEQASVEAALHACHRKLFSVAPQSGELR